MKVRTVTKFGCPICEKEYSNEKDAQQCLNIGIDRRIASVGDIVEVSAGYGWYDGKKSWIKNPNVNLKGIKSHGNCFEDCCTYSFYYVITAIDQDPENPHRLRYHIFTKAMTGEQGHREGYTYAKYHHTPKIVTKPPVCVINDSKNLLGKKSNYLL